VILELLLALVVVAGLLYVAYALLSDFRLMTRPPLPPMWAWRLYTDNCRIPIAQQLDPETLEPTGLWIPVARFTGMMHVRDGILYAREIP